MKRAIILFALVLFTTSLSAQNSVRYKFQVRIPTVGIEVLEEAQFFEGGNFSIPDVVFNHPPFNELYEAVKGGTFYLDDNSIQQDLYMEITMEGLNPLTGALYQLFQEPLFLNLRIDVWELPDNYNGPYPPAFDPTSPFYFNPGTGLELRVNKTDAFFAFLNQIGISPDEDLGFAFITTTGFSGNDITSTDTPEYVSFKTNHLSKFGGGRGHIHDVVIENQTIILSPAKGYSGSSDTPRLKLFFSPTDSLILQWDRFITDPNMKFKFGSSSGNYNLGELSVSGQRKGFIPGGAPYNLSTGRYYGLITNSIHNTFDEIESDYNADPAGIEFSNEIQFIIEAQNAPIPTSPKGEINDATPIFQWDAIPGVPAYWLIVSSTPFTVVSLPNGDVSVQGANILWNYITDKTTVQYGEVNPNSPYNEQAQPLLSGNEYNYTILNLYDDQDISFASTVFSGAFAFTYVAPQQIEKPQLVEPADSSEFIGTNEILFKWDPVQNANNYTIYLYQRVQSFAGNDQQIDLPIWNSTTTNTSISYPAITTLSKGSYVWNVIATDNSGNGALSETYLFTYDIEMGSFRVQAVNTETGDNLLGFNVEANAVSGGVSPANPFIVTNSTSYVDSLVVGTYQFVGSKTGFYDSTVTAEIVANGQTNLTIYLRPYPSIVSGTVIDQNNSPVEGATVKFTNLLTSDENSVTTNSNGEFSATIPKGTYKVTVTKP
ncbi:MAG: carboxypeptidase regulatory-like domain-containing protein, partial [Ignavibacteria bacterium]